jgi:fructokinase
MYAGIELGGSKIVCRVVEEGVGVVAEERFGTSTPAAAIERLATCIERAVGKGDLRAIGVASFGPIVVDATSPHYGRLLTTPKAGWSEFDLRAALASRFQVPLAIDTDVNAAALAEQQAGAARGLRSVAYVTVGTGIGGGLAIEGCTLKGALHPEVGHMRLRRRAGDGHISTCAFHDDCAEGLAAGPAVVRRLDGRGALQEAPEVMQIVAGYLGDLAANLVLAWAPHQMVFGGGVMAAMGLLDQVRQAMRAAIGHYRVSGPSQADFLVPASLADAGLEGALLLARLAAGPEHGPSENPQGGRARGRRRARRVRQ